ncbi:MAG: hypothetical protein ACREN5_05885, partial [Gemmatimonadales bacterium]
SGGVMAAAAQAVGSPGTPAAPLLQLAAGGGAGAVAYLLLSRMLRVDELSVAWGMLRRRGAALR